MTSVLRRSGNLSAVQRPTVGDTKTSLVKDDHMGWLRCDGRALNKNVYPQLFNVIGYSFGGADVSFNLPDPQGRVLAFVGQAIRTDPSSNMWEMGDLSGEETHKLTLSEMPRHNHDISDGTGINEFIQDLSFGFTDISGVHTHEVTDPGHAHSYVNQVGDQAVNTLTTQADAADQVDYNQITSTNTTGITINAAGAHAHRIRNAGGNQPHNNIQPTIWLGNLFVYAGKLFTGSDGNQAPYSTNKFPYANNTFIY